MFVKDMIKISDRLTEEIPSITNNIPVDQIFGILRDYGITPVQEDGTPWSGIFCGQQGRANIDLLDINGEPIEIVMLRISWYRYETGRYEIITYLS